MNHKHGQSKTPLYSVWCDMIARCYRTTHKRWADYGARGIAVCDRWRTNFANFREDMGDRPSPLHSLDRTDNNGHYEPSNCRWATKKEQANNCRLRASQIRLMEPAEKFMRELMSWGGTADRHNLGPQIWQNQNSARQFCKRHGWVVFEGGYWRITDAGCAHFNWTRPRA